MDRGQQSRSREFAARATAEVSAAVAAGEAPGAALEKIFQRLHGAVAPMVGELGYVAVMKRAIWLASRDARAAGFPAETALTQSELSPLVEQAGVARALPWTEEIVGQAFSLLQSFLGDALMQRLAERALALPSRPDFGKPAKERAGR